MSDEVEMPDEALERHERAEEAASAHGRKDEHVVRMTLVVIVLAMASAIAGKISTDAELRYLAHHIERSDIWNEYQGKSDRQFFAENMAKLAAVLPNGGDPAVQSAIAEFKSAAAHMASDTANGGGKAQLAEKAHREESLRDAASERLEGFELVVSILSIAIGLSSASLLARGRTSRRLLGAIGAGSGLIAILYGAFVFLR